MNKETLDARSKIELSNLLLQIGFKKEAVMELLAAAALFEKNKDFNNAVKVYEKILDIDPNNRTSQNKLLQLQPDRKRKRVESIAKKLTRGKETLGELIRDFEKIITVKNDEIDLVIGLGRSFLYAGLYEEAKNIFADLMKHHDFKDIVLPYYIETLIYLKELEKATKRLKEAKLSFLVDRERLSFLDALLMEHKGDIDKAIEMYERIYTKNPLNKDAEIRLNTLYEIKKGEFSPVEEVTQTKEKEEGFFESEILKGIDSLIVKEEKTEVKSDHLLERAKEDKSMVIKEEKGVEKEGKKPSDVKELENFISTVRNDKEKKESVGERREVKEEEKKVKEEKELVFEEEKQEVAEGEKKEETGVKKKEKLMVVEDEKGEVTAVLESKEKIEVPVDEEPKVDIFIPVEEDKEEVKDLIEGVKEEEVLIPVESDVVDEKDGKEELKKEDIKEEEVTVEKRKKLKDRLLYI